MKTDKKIIKRILFWYDGIIDVIDETKGHGGAEVQLYLLARELAKNPANKIFVSCKKKDLNKNYYCDKDFLERIRQEKLNLAPIIKNKSQSNSKNLLRKNIFNNMIKKIIVRIEKIINTISITTYLVRTNPDVIITRTAGNTAYKSMIFAKMFKKKSIFMVAHDNECNGTFEKENPSSAKNFSEVIRQTDLIICQNEYQRKHIKKNYGKESRIMKSMYPIVEFKEKKREHSLWVGRCERWKRPEEFLELAKRNPKQKFKMICAAAKKEEDYYKTIRDIAKNTKNLVFIEYVPFSKMDSEFQKAKIFVNTSTAEGFPNTFIQAMKNKTPILSLNVDPDEVLENGQGISCKDNVKDFQKRFSRIIKNKKLLTDMGNKGFSYAKENHDVTTISRDYERIIDGLCGKKK